MGFDCALGDLPWARANVALFRIDATHANAFAGRRMPAACGAALDQGPR